MRSPRGRGPTRAKRTRGEGALLAPPNSNLLRKVAWYRAAEVPDFVRRGTSRRGACNLFALDFLGIPVRVSDPRCLLGREDVNDCRESSNALTVWVGGARWPQGEPRGVIRGEGFAVSPDSMDMCCRLRGTSLRARRLDFVRKVAFAMGLLLERRGAWPGRPRWRLIILHASGISGERGALLFCGHSTFGKSTISSLLARRYRKFADDLAYVWCEATVKGTFLEPKALDLERYVGCCFPDGTADGGRRQGDLPAHESEWAAPLTGLFWLKKSKGFRLSPMTPAESIVSLLPPLCPDAEGNLNRMRFLKGLVRQVPLQRLEFRKEARPLEDFLRCSGCLR